MTVDFGKRSDDYAEHRPGFPDSFYERLDALRAVRDADVLDLGTGPGVLALEWAKRGANVTGVDIAPNQVATARTCATTDGLDARCRFVVGRAEQLTFDDASFDVATAGQCWHWFDVAATMTELQRVLRPGGLLVVAAYCYLARLDEVARATEELILEFNPTWTMAGTSGIYAEHIDELILGGFELVEQFCYDHDREFTHAGWRGRMRTCNGVGSGSLTDDDVAAFDARLADLLRERFPKEPLAVSHRVWATVVRRP